MTWRDCRLGDLMRLQRGHDLPAQDREDGEVPVVSSSGITGYHSKEKAAAPGVVTGRYGTLGEVFYLDRAYWPLNTALYVTDFKGNDPKFTAYFLKNALKDYQSDKAAVPGIDRNLLHELNVRAPDLALQRRIVDVLAVYDDLIDNNQRRKKLLEDSVRLLFDEWFVRLRHPSVRPGAADDAPPDGWSRRPLEQALWLQRGFDLPNQDREDGTVPIYGASGINGHHSAAKVKGPGIVTGRAGSLGLVQLVQEDFWPLNTTLWVKEFRTVTLRFALHLLRNMGLERYGQGATMPMLDRKVVHPVEVLLPPPGPMQAFEDFATDVYDQIRTLGQANLKLTAARDLLLPRLMSGELAV
ncbi:MAG: restriction endonuclease subunit S [Burkholderiaceae bacterium]|jgi:type I restriction enzyme S subunit|nr:restriction endonuclease subunit S [Burkholderiaceae bacterium]